MATIYRRGRLWWIQYYESATGSIQRRSLKTANRRIALLAKSTIEGKLVLKKRMALEGDPDVPTACALYLASTERLKTPHTQLTDRLRLEKLSAQLGPVRLSRLSPKRLKDAVEAVERAAKAREGGRFGPSTYNKYLKLLRTLCAWCQKEGYLFDNPAREIERLAVDHVERSYLPYAQWPAFLELAQQRSPHHYLLIATALLAGLRLDELLHLEWTDLDFAAHRIHVRIKHDWAPKFRKERKLPLFSSLQAILEPYRQPSGFCFLTPPRSLHPGLPYKSDPRPTVLSRLYQDPRFQLAARGNAWHLLRHSFATALAQLGVSIWQIKEWMGHADVRTTDLYAHPGEHFADHIGLLDLHSKIPGAMPGILKSSTLS